MTTSPSLVLNFASGTLDPRVTFSRQQAATDQITFTGSNGLIQYASINLLTYSQDFTNAVWVKNACSITALATTAPDGTLTGSKLVEDSTSANHDIHYARSDAAGATYSAFVYAKAAERNWIVLSVGGKGYAWFNVSTGVVGSVVGSITPTIVSAGRGWYLCTLPNLPTASNISGFDVYVAAANGATSYQGDGTSGVYLWGAMLNPGATAGPYTPTTSAASGSPRFNYTPGWVAQGLLIEEQRQNLLTYSNTFSNAAWTATNISLASSITSPDGTANAFTATASAGNGTLYQTVTLTAAANTISFWIQRKTGTGTVQLTLDGTNFTAVPPSASWQQLSITATPTAGSHTVGLRIVTNGDAVNIAFAQCELGAFATSAIVTTSAVVTRYADNASMTGTNFSGWYNQTQGTFKMDLAATFPASGSTYITSVNDGTSSYYLQAYILNSIGRPYAASANGGTAIIIFAGVALTSTVPFKLARAYKVNSDQLAVNGVASAGGAPAAIPTVSQLNLGNQLGFFPINGSVSKYAYYPTALAVPQLKGLST
jgi:hypothetical protein